MKTVDEQLASLDMFAGLSKSDMKFIRRLMTPIEIPAGKEFIRQGEAGREAFIILEGQATVRRGGRVVTTVGPGDVLGELSVLSGAHRTASVTADTVVQAEVLSRREFSSLLDSQPKLAKKLLISVIQRLHALEPSIIG
ncbi:MAG: cyclic nucleotide-binding domain-containing protein [Acidimicrobiales bacterium]|nr:cyclic nucleotide-binding domain-containing protein [Acidimicrobiales bacterium]